MNNINTEFTHDNITKSYDNFGPENRKINIVVNGICAEIHVKKSTNDKINIRYENNGNERQKQKYSFYSFMEDDTVYAGIRVVGRSVFMFNLKAYSIDIHIEVPENIGIIDLKPQTGTLALLMLHRILFMHRHLVVTLHLTWLMQEILKLKVPVATCI